MIRRYLILWWTLGTALAFGVASFVVDIIPGRHGILDGLIVGAIVGIVQWVLLLLSEENLIGWPVATAAGWAIVGVFNPDWPVWAGPWFAMLQWIVLRRYTRDAGWWVISSAGGWLVTWFLAYVLADFVTVGLRGWLANAMMGSDAITNTPFYIVNALDWLIGTLPYGLISATALAYIIEPEPR